MASKEQQKFSSALRKSYPLLHVMEDCRGFGKLVSKDGYRYEVDIYLPQFSVGFEYQGDFHFRSIKNKFNDPDKSRKNDVLKYDMVREHKFLSVVELFPQDLYGNIFDNMCTRIENTIPTYEKRVKQKKLMCLHAYLKAGMSNLKFSIDHYNGAIVFKDGEDRIFYRSPLMDLYKKVKKAV